MNQADHGDRFQEERAAPGAGGAPSHRNDVADSEPARDAPAPAPEDEVDAEGRTDARRRVLRLVAEGKISVEDAAALLAALEGEEVEQAPDVLIHGWPPGPFPLYAPAPPPLPPVVLPPPGAPGWGPHQPMLFLQQAAPAPVARAASPAPPRSPVARAAPAPPAAPPGPPSPAAGTLFYRRGARGRRLVAPTGALFAYHPAAFNVAVPPPGMPAGALGTPAGGPGAAPKRTLVILTRDGSAEVHARVPLDAGNDVERLLPRQMRERLAACEVDLQQLLASVREHPGWDGGDPLLLIQEGETEIRVTLE